MTYGRTIEFLSQNILLSVLFLCLGVGFVLFFPNLYLIGGIFLTLVFIVLWGVTGRHRMIFFGFSGIIAYAIGVWMPQGAMIASDTSNLWGKMISGEGLVIDDPSSGAFIQRVLIRISQCEEGNRDQCRGERVMIETDRWTRIRFGETIHFSCIFERPENFSEDFDYRMYLASRGIRAMCRKADVSIVENKKTFLGYLGGIRRMFERSVDRSIEQPYAALGNGFLFGGSSRMSDELADYFSKTSMTHIVAVSGYNVSLIAGYAFFLAVYLGFWRKTATIVAVLSIFVFILFVGSPSSAIRAGVMGSILLFTLALGRSRGSTRVLLYAGAVMVMINPLILRYDVGFQLSFLATLGIITLAPLYEKIRPRNIVIQGIAEIIFMTTSAQLFVLPIILWNFHSLSLMSIVVNVLVLWTIPFAMFFTFLSSLLGLVWGWLGFVVGMPAQGILWYDIKMVKFFASMDWSVMNVGRIGLFFTIVWYGTLGGVTWWLFWNERRMMRQTCKNQEVLNV